jgi:hypothetical protein
MSARAPETFEAATPAFHEGQRSHRFDNGVTAAPQRRLSLQQAQHSLNTRLCGRVPEQHSANPFSNSMRAS